MLEIHHFLKTYPTGFQLEIEALHLKKGIHLIQGENGAGKSTLFKAIAGIQTYSGNIILDRIDLKKNPLLFRQWVNFSEAEPIYPDFLSLDDLVLFVARAKRACDKQVEALKESFAVSSFSANPISTYSSGMLKKTSLLLAFLGGPKLIILDEPFTTIDTGSQDLLIQLIIKKSAEGASFLLSTHQKAFVDLLSFESVHSLSNGKMLLHQ